MTRKRTSAADATPIRVVIVTMDTHLAAAVDRARAALVRDLPGLTLSLHAASEWSANASALERCRADIARGDIVIATMLFMEEHFLPVLDALQARRTQCDAIVCAMSAAEVVKLTRVGRFDMDKPANGPIALLKRLRGGKGNASTGGAQQMKMLRRIPQLLRFIPGTAQDVRAYFMTLQYWLAGSDENIQHMVRFLVDRYAAGPREVLRGAVKAQAPVHYPETGVYHPRMPGRVAESVAKLPLIVADADARGTVGLLVLRSYLLAGNSKHYDGVIAAFEARGLRVIPAFASGLDSRPAIEQFFVQDGRAVVDAVVSLSGLLARRRSSLQRRPRRRGSAGESRRALPRRAPGRVPDRQPMGLVGAGTAAGRKHHHGGDPGTRRRNQPHRVRRPCGCPRHDVHWLPPRLHLRCAGRRAGHVRLPGPRRGARRACRETRCASSQRTRRAQGGAGAVQLPAQRRQHRHRGVPRRLRKPVRDTAVAASRRLCHRRTGQRGRTARSHPARQRGAVRRRRQRAHAHRRGRSRAPRALAQGNRSGVGPGARTPAQRRPFDLRAGRAVRQRAGRRTARHGLRRRPDEAVVRTWARADARVLGVLPLPARGLPRPCRAAFRHARLARVHAGQADRPLRRLLARTPDRRPAQSLPVCIEQPVGRHDRQAPRGRDADQLPDATRRARRVVPRPDGPQVVARPLARARTGSVVRKARPGRTDPVAGGRARTRHGRAAVVRRSRRTGAASRRRRAGTRVHVDSARHARRRSRADGRRAYRPAAGHGRIDVGSGAGPRRDRSAGPGHGTRRRARSPRHAGAGCRVA